MKNKALVVIDYQNDFVYGALGTQEARSISNNIKTKVKEARTNGNLVIFTHDTHFDDYLSTREGRWLPVPHCLSESKGWMIADNIDDFPHSIVRKYDFGFFGWYDVLSKCDVVELVGVCTDICVVSNALILRSLFSDMEIVVDASCCAGTTPEAHKAALQVMKSCQITVIGE